VWSAGRNWRRKVEQIAAEYLTAEVKARLGHMDPAKVEICGREGRLYLGLDDRPLVEDAGHYLIYGSEYNAAFWRKQEDAFSRTS
jgi:hypothetical protein